MVMDRHDGSAKSGMVTVTMMVGKEEEKEE